MIVGGQELNPGPQMKEKINKLIELMTEQGRDQGIHQWLERTNPIWKQ